MVEKGSPGYQAEVIEGKVSLRSIWQADITLDEVRVPEENRLPGARPFKDTAKVLATTRSTCAWAALGHATSAYDTALRYALQRRQFGQPLASFQIIQQRLVSMLADLTAMQLYCLQIGRLAEAGRLTETVAGLAKMHNTRKARAIAADARDMLGGNGILLDYQVMRHMVDMEAIHTFEGTETMQTLIVGRAITGEVALDGTVPSYPQYLEAAAAARRLTGVTRVHNHLEVVLRPGDECDDATLTAANNLLGLTVTVPNTVRATARDGNLTLAGFVHNGAQRAAAEQAVAGLPGVRDVRHNIEVISGDPLSDVTVLVQDALDRYAVLLDNSKVTVSTRGHTVTLTGHVRSWAEHDAVVAAAWMAHGISDVHDQVQVTG